MRDACDRICKEEVGGGGESGGVGEGGVVKEARWSGVTSASTSSARSASPGTWAGGSLRRSMTATSGVVGGAVLMPFVLIQRRLVGAERGDFTNLLN